MNLNVRNWRWVGLVAVAALLLATSLTAAERRGRRTKIGEYISNAETVEMFAAMEKGDIAVKLIPKDSTQAQVVIENKTDKPLNVKLPDAFAGVPLLGQNLAGAGGAGGNRNSNRSGSNQGNQGNQGMGGGMGGMMGGGMGMFSLPPEQVGKFKVPTVCLDHGKADPRPSIPYQIKPLDSYTTKAGVRELCQALGKGQTSQRVAQAAAWHLNNDMSWEQLAGKQIKHLNGPSQPYFSPAEIQVGMQVANTAVRAAKEQEKDKPAPSSTTPSSITGTK
jgi:hypothetical protein